MRRRCSRFLFHQERHRAHASPPMTAEDRTPYRYRRIQGSSARVFAVYRFDGSHCSILRITSRKRSRSSEPTRVVSRSPRDRVCGSGTPSRSVPAQAGPVLRRCHQRVRTSRLTVISKEHPAQLPFGKEFWGWRSKQSNHLREIRAASVLLFSWIAASKQMAAFKKIPDLVE